jgi:hypothetical protein
MVDMAKPERELASSRSAARAIARRTSLGKFVDVSVMSCRIESFSVVILQEDLNYEKFCTSSIYGKLRALEKYGLLAKKA